MKKETVLEKGACPNCGNTFGFYHLFLGTKEKSPLHSFQCIHCNFWFFSDSPLSRIIGLVKKE